MSCSAELRAALLAVLLSPLPALATDPELHTMLPRGAQRGGSVEVTVHGKRLGDGVELMFYRPGIVVESLSVKNGSGTNCVRSPPGSSRRRAAR